MSLIGESEGLSGSENTNSGFLRKGLTWISVALLVVGIVIPVVVFLVKEGSNYPLMLEEVRGIVHDTVKESESQFQSTKIQNYMYDGSNYSSAYISYLNNLDSIASINNYHDLKEVVNFLRNGDNGVNYTPLNFDFAFLDLDVLNDMFKENLSNAFYDSLENNTINGNTGDKVGATLIGNERYKLLDSNISCLRFDVYDITDISQNISTLSVEENRRRKGIYYSIYGTNDPNACTLRPDIAGITDRKYLVVYTLQYTVKYRVYFTSEYGRIRPGSWRDARFTPGPNTHMNSMGYLAYPDITETYQDLYYIVN